MSNLSTRHSAAADVSTKAHPYLLDHAFQGMLVLPGSTYLTLALATAAEAPRELTDVVFPEAYLLQEGTDQQLRIAVEGDRFRAVSGPEADPVVHAEGRLRPAAGAPPAGLDREDIAARCPDETAGAAFYAALRGRGNEYGPCFQGIETVRTGDGEALARIRRHEQLRPDEHGLFHPALLDASLQALAACHDAGGRTYFLKSVARAAVHGRPDGACWAHAVIEPADRAATDAAVGDVKVYGDDGALLAELDGLRLEYLGEPAARARIAVSATFTAEPVEDTLAFWMDKLGLPCGVEFAPYNQVFQSLFDPQSLLAANDQGFNVVLARFEDWVRFRHQLALRVDEAEKERILAGRERYRLPNGAEIAHLVRYETDYVYKEIFVDDAYRRHGIHLPDDAVVVDVGANIGLFSLWINQQCKGATVYSFEPSPQAYACLAANARLYGANSHAFNCGLSDSGKTLPFTFYRNASVFSSYHADADEDEAAVRAVVENMLRDSGHADEEEIARYADDLMDGRMDSETVEVPLRSLSSVIDEHGIDRIDLLKVDVEKAEMDVLNGIREEHWPLIRQLVLEVHDQEGPLIRAVLDLLKERGFETHLDEETLLAGSGLYNIYATPAGREVPRGESGPSVEEEIERNVDEMIAGLRAAAERSAVPYIVGICPPSPQSASHGAFYRRLEDKIAAAASGLGTVHFFSSGELQRLYPVADYYDESGDKLGHVPFTPAAFAAIGTMIARRIHNLATSPAKVIALDCDNTLWKGVVGEDGPAGIEPFRDLQEFMVRQHEAGMLLALCSKNVPADVDAVFETRDDMPLREEHVVLSKINWNAKSGNLVEMADELNLGLDSFVFVDDNPVELAEVAAACPQVLTLQTPKEPAEHARFLDHVWAFDHLRITEEDRKRTAMYAANVEREQARSEAPSLAEFIDSLKLDIAVGDMQPADLPRVSQLTHRTNQFNFTTIRRSEAEIAQALETGTLRCLVTRVKDRFGDYGLVGVLLFAEEPDALTVDTFLLSCRVLGRGVEYRMLRELGAIAQAAGHGEVRVPWRPTEKNRPARQFIEAVGGEHREEAGDGLLFRLPAADVAALAYRPGESVEVEFKRKKKGAAKGRPAASDLANEIATSLRDPEQVLARVLARKTQERPDSLGEFVAAEGDLERTIARVWQDVLGIGRVGTRDNFFEVGGTSLKAVQVIAQLKRELGLELRAVALFEQPTIAGLAKLVAEGGEDAGKDIDESRARGARRRARRKARRAR